MSMLDILNSDAFKLSSLTAAINNQEYRPGYLGKSGLFKEDGIATTTAVVEVQDGVLDLVPVASRGAAGAALETADRRVESFVVPHLPQHDTLLADSLQNVREFGSEDKAEAMQNVINSRLHAMAQKNEYTLESHRVAAVQGKFIDAAGAEQSIFTKLGVSEKTVPMALTVDTTEVRDKCSSVVDAIEEALQGLSYERIEVLCGKTFWSNLIKHKSVEKTYLNSVNASELRGDARQSFSFGGMTFVRYHGTSAVKIADTEARAYPVGVMDFFLTNFAPANYEETVNTIGLPYYAKIERMKFDKGVELEVQSNPLNICTRPKALIKLKSAQS